MELKVLPPERIPEAAALAAAAFRDDPTASHLIPAAAARPALLPRVFQASLALDAAKGGVLLGAFDGRLLGFASWAPPGAPASGLAPWLAAAPRLLPLLPRPGLCLRALAVLSAIEAARPAEPHAYLKTLAVSPEAQRRGVGRALIEEVAGRASALGAFLWLETFKPANRAYYKARGFVEAGEHHPPRLSAFWTFRRP